MLPQTGPLHRPGTVGGRQDVCRSSLGRHAATLAEQVRKARAW
jgi:hypothetical protein